VNRRQVAKEISSVIFRKELFSSARELKRTKVQNNFNQRDVKRGEKTLNKIFLELMKKKRHWALYQKYSKNFRTLFSSCLIE